MPFYNLAAEYSSLVVICLATVSFALDESKGSTRYGALKWMQLATLASIVITIASLITTDYYNSFPVWVIELFKYLYFFTAPIAAPMALFYGITLIYNKTYKFNFIKNYVWAWLPYAIYCLIIATNGVHRLIFTISPTQGYIRGEFFRITYVIALIYFAIVIYFVIKNFNKPQRNSLLIICLNLLIASMIFCTQLFVPSLQLSGIASVVGVLIIQFYVQNVSHCSDSLTELYNRATLTRQMTKYSRSDTRYSLFVFSIRNFKGVNERNGLKYGDDLLEQIALRLRSMLQHRQIYRFSGDEFAVLISNYDSQTKYNIEEVYQNICKPFNIEEGSIAVDYAYARVDFPEFGIKTEEIMSAMDYSLSALKKGAGNVNYYYDSSVSEKMKRRNYVIERIKQALDTDGFEAHYQPIYYVKQDEFTMAEALIRMKPEQGEFISPGEFIPIAEETGMIIKITKTMLELVCSDYQRMIETFGSNLKLQHISVNFPYVMFMKKGAAEEVYEIVTRHNLLPEMIKIELTERTFATDIKNTLVIMNEFIKLGFVFELDDFGVEYSNFSMFFNVPIRIIKFDRSLVVSSTASKERRNFFYKFLGAVKALDKDITVVMEGVEDEGTKQFLIECDCDYIQGFVFSKPLPYSAYLEFLSNR